MLVVSSKYNILRYAIMMVACMSVGELFNQIDIKLPDNDNDHNTLFVIANSLHEL